MDDENAENIGAGIGRLYYFLSRLILVATTIFAVIYFGPESRVFSIVSLGSLVAGVVLDVMRLRNIGISQWLIFLRFVPYLGLLLSIGLQSAQPGWIENKRLDRAGWLIVGVHAVLIALVIFLMYRMQLTVFNLAF